MQFLPHTTRFAPSPSGDLHLGGALVALASLMIARQTQGTMRVRMEDLDTPRVVHGAAEKILEDLDWLGLTGDGEVLFQSQRLETYEAAVIGLRAEGVLYPCDCSRSEIARAASAPHEGEESIYPGTCRKKDPSREMKRVPALRIVADGTITFADQVAGTFAQDLATEVGDFVIQRGDGVFAYQLAVAVDDAAMRVTEVVRGRDLLASTPRQILLMDLLGYSRVPSYAHVPLVVGKDGGRLSKRTAGCQIRTLRHHGISSSEVVGWLLSCLGATSLSNRIVWPTVDLPIPEAWEKLSPA